jgi:glycosyltransferase involved in cell wall biosynthesis
MLSDMSFMSPSMSPRVSIIVNCYNQGRFLERSVASVLAQSCTDLECIIIDDGSTDDTAAVADRLTHQDPRVRYYRQDNQGLPAARNFGVSQARGQWIQCLDADDWIHPDKILTQLADRPTDASTPAAVLYCDYERVMIQPDGSIGDTQAHVIGQLTPEAMIARMLQPDFLTPTPHPALQQAMLMDRRIFEQGARFPEQFKALGDRYFAIELLVAGVPFVYTPMVGAFYTKHQTNRTNNWNYMRDYYISFYETVHRQHPALRKQCSVGLSYLIDEAIREQDQPSLRRLLPLAAAPITINWMGQDLTLPAPLLPLASQLRRLIPSFVLYKKYRGPRSDRALAAFRKLIPGKAADPATDLSN